MSGRRPARSKPDRIIDAALKVFAQRGLTEATLQAIADTADVSVGLVQYHFGSKDGLVAAVDAHAMELIRAAMAQPLSEEPTEAVLELGRRVTGLLAEQRTVVDYLARLLANGTASGVAFFDATMAIVGAHWRQMADKGVTRPDLDLVWAALNPTVLVFGVVILRRHIDRYLPESFCAPAQLARWQDSVNMLLRFGQFAD
ncbi:TetR/AcrR family transcriptional regulator [Mycolicibacterium sp. CBM1]